MTITAVLFDADGVLQRSPPLGDRLASAFGIGPDQIDACVADVFAGEKPCLIGAGDYAVVIEPMLAKWGGGCSAEAFFEHWLTFAVDAGVLGVVGELRRCGVYCAVASNQERHRARRLSAALGGAAAFDGEFYSCHVGHAKPSEAYFHAVLAQAQADPGRTLFIDDIQANIDAARAVGLHAERFELPQAGSGADELRALLARHGLSA
jgi:putative hydrolase of the HAD superfamily